MNMVDLLLQLEVVKVPIYVIINIIIIILILILPLLAAIAAVGRIAALRLCMSTLRLPTRTGALARPYPLFRGPREKSAKQIFR